MIRAHFKQRRNMMLLCFCSAFSKSKVSNFEVMTLKYTLIDI